MTEVTLCDRLILDIEFFSGEHESFWAGDHAAQLALLLVYDTRYYVQSIRLVSLGGPYVRECCPI